MSYTLTINIPAPTSFIRYIVDSLYSLFGRDSAMPRGYLNLDNYDIDGATGFFPPQPLQRLDGVFELWERGLEEAEGNLSLGSDGRAEAKAKRARGEAWRAQIRSVSIQPPKRIGY